MTSKILLSFDVEDWFCVTNMKDHFPFEAWDSCELRVRIGTEYILEQLARRSIRATFFILGWIAGKCPDLVRDIASGGHEIASHGYSHQTLERFTRETLREDLNRSVEAIHCACGVRPLGFRAPSFSITRRNLWALDVISECGFTYDSSIFPVRHPEYGIPDFPRHIQRLGDVWEVPLTTFPIGSLNAPISGGGYFRFLPIAATELFLRRAQRTQTAVLYFHPWEFDPAQPRIDLSRSGRIRHYTGLRQNRKKFERLLDSFSLGPIQEGLDTLLHSKA